MLEWGRALGYALQVAIPKGSYRSISDNSKLGGGGGGGGEVRPFFKTIPALGGFLID